MLEDDGPPNPAGRELDCKVESYCWCHNEIESIPKNVYVVCYECGHVWTKSALRQAYRREAKRCAVSLGIPEREVDWADFGPTKVGPWRWARFHIHRLAKRADKIYFCQVCIHDF